MKIDFAFAGLYRNIIIQEKSTRKCTFMDSDFETRGIKYFKHVR